MGEKEKEGGVGWVRGGLSRSEGDNGKGRSRVEL